MTTKRLSLDFNYVMDQFVGSRGLTEQELEEVERNSAEHHAALMKLRESGEIGFFDLPYNDEMREEVRDTADAAVKDIGEVEDVVVIGIGGSALGNITIHGALNHPLHNLLPREKRNAPRIHVMDNPDPDRFSALLDVIDLDRALFNVITKSGGTVETISQFLIVLDLLKQRLSNGRWAKHVVVTTDPEKGALRELAKTCGFRSLVVPPNVGGRFSVLSPVGLLSAYLSGVDIDELHAGARAMAERCTASSIWKNPAYMAATVCYLLDKLRGVKMVVLMAYASGLEKLAQWFRQLYAESLGKKLNLQGKVVHTGGTPIAALGSVDQHSQIQLYVEGPFDKVVVFVEVEEFARDVSIPNDVPAAFDYLSGKTLQELMRAELLGTRQALTANERPSMTLSMPKVDAFHLGEVFYFFEVMTAFAGQLYQVNAFDQPGVEHGKNAAYALLGRNGYEELRKEIETDLQRREERYILA